MLVSFGLSVRARLADVKKLSVVTFLPLFKYGDMSRITTLSGSDSLAERSSSFPKYGKALHRYLVSSTNFRILSQTCQICSPVLGKSAPGFRWKELLICSKILSRSVAEKAVINVPLPYFRSQCKFFTLQALRTCSLQIKSQLPHYFTKSVLRHGIREKRRCPIYIPQHIIVN